MSDLLKAGQKWLAEKLTKHASREITYRRGEVESTVTATIGKTMADQDTGDGLVLRMEIRDYLIDSADLKLDGQPTLPERGEQVPVELDSHEVSSATEEQYNAYFGTSFKQLE